MTRHRLWILARTYWFDALLVAALGVEIAWVVVSPVSYTHLTLPTN